MSDRTYASWVEPIARSLAADRREFIEFASAMPPEFWPQANRSVDGWTNSDLLAHLAGGNDQLVQLDAR